MTNKEKQFQEACRNGELDIASRLCTTSLWNKGVDVNARDSDGRSALMIVSEKQHIEIIKLLISKGADVNAMDNQRMIALMFASSSFDDRTENIAMLLSSGANVNMKNKYGETALIYSVRKGHLKATELLISHGALVNEKDSYPPIIAASENGCRTVVEFLIKKGANINACDKDGNTALMKAAYYGECEMVKLLISNGAKLDYVNKNGLTAMIWTCKNADNFSVPEVIEILQSHGADANIRDANGRTGIDYVIDHAIDNMDILIIERIINIGTFGNIEKEFVNLQDKLFARFAELTIVSRKVIKIRLGHTRYLLTAIIKALMSTKKLDSQVAHQTVYDGITFLCPQCGDYKKQLKNHILGWDGERCQQGLISDGKGAEIKAITACPECNGEIVIVAYDRDIASWEDQNRNGFSYEQRKMEEINKIKIGMDRWSVPYAIKGRIKLVVGMDSVGPGRNVKDKIASKYELEHYKPLLERDKTILNPGNYFLTRAMWIIHFSKRDYRIYFYDNKVSKIVYYDK